MSTERKAKPVRPALIWLVLLIIVLSLSCAGGRRPVYPVRGQVFFEKKPTPEALVIFHPLNDPDPDAPRPIARVKADGSFTPTTYTTHDGAPAGEYAVTITWVKERDNQDVPKEEQRAPQNLLPGHYGKVGTSELRVRIQKGNNELTPFHLTRK